MCGLTLTVSEYAFILQYTAGTHRLYHPHLHYVIIIYIHTRQHRLALASMTNCSDSQLLFSSCSVHAAGLCGKEMLRQRDRPGIVPDSVLTTTSNKLIVGLDLNRFLVFVFCICPRAINRLQEFNHLCMRSFYILNLPLYIFFPIQTVLSDSL